MRPNITTVFAALRIGVRHAGGIVRHCSAAVVAGSIENVRRGRYRDALLGGVPTAPALDKDDKVIFDGALASSLKPGSKPIDLIALNGVILKFEYSLDVFRAAAAQPVCDWRLDLSKGPYLSLAHLSRMREIAKALRLRAWLRLGQHHTADAEEDIAAILRSAMHTALRPF